MLLTLQQLTSFLPASALVVALPGPDILYVVSVSAARGAWRGIAAACGFALGVGVHVALVGAGVGALASSEPAYLSGLRVCGGLYLTWSGASAAYRRSKGTNTEAGRPDLASLATVARAALANVLNPKVLVFFVAYLPSFVDAKRGDFLLQVVQLGALFQILTVAIFSAAALMSAVVIKRYAGSRARRYIELASGLLLVLLGILLIAGAHTTQSPGP
jgi:threonine/homoserine/homoserine lactone efflux protein